MECPACPGHWEEQPAEIQEMSNSLQSHLACTIVLFTLLSYSLYPWSETQIQEQKSPTYLHTTASSWGSEHYMIHT